MGAEGPRATTPFAAHDLRVEEVLAGLPGPFVLLDREWRLLHTNPAGERFLRRSLADLVGRSIWEAFPDVPSTPFYAHYERAMRDGVVAEFTEFYAPLGRWLSVQAVPNRAGLAVHFHDVDALKAAELRASRLADVHAALQAVATAAVGAEGDPELVLDLVCRRAVELVGGSGAWLVRFTPVGYRVVAATSSGVEGVPRVGDELEVRAGSELAAVRAGDSVVLADDVGARLAAVGLGAAVLVPIRLEGRVWGALSVAWPRPTPGAAEAEPWLRDLSDLVSVTVGSAAARAELARQASTDALTGLANLRALHARIDQQVARALRHGTPVSVAMVDVDHFKAVNDSYGHEVGDGVLKAVAAHLLATCREEDMAARIGGDEFALVLDSCGEREALEVVERLRVRIGAALDLAPEPVTVSIGVSGWQPGLDREALQRRADEALYRAKLHGRNAAGVPSSAVPERRAALPPRPFWQLTVDALDKHLAVLDGEGRVIATSRAWRRFGADNGGDPARTGVGASYLEVCDAAAEPRAAAVAVAIRGLLAGGDEPFEVEYPCHSPERDRWFRLRAARFETDEPRRVVVEHEDVSAQHGAGVRAAFQSRLLSIVGVAVAAIDERGRIAYWNRAAEELFGWAADEVVGRGLQGLGLFDLAGIDVPAVTAARERQGHWMGELEATDRAGRRFTALVSNTTLRDEAGDAAGVIGTVVDLTDHRRREQDLTAARDDLRTVTESIADGLVVFDAGGSVVYANPAARSLLGAGDDLTGTDAIRALYGTAPTAAAADLLDPWRPTAHAEEDTFRTSDGTPIAVEWTASALMVPSDAPAHGLTDGTAGGRVVVFHDVSERQARTERLRREADGLRWAKRIREALDEDRFVLHAQPIIEIATGRTTHHELLIRLREPDGALVAPGEFLPAAEEHGLMFDIDSWVMEQAARYAAAGLAIHFNLSAQTIGDARAGEALRRAVQSAGAAPGRLTVELTETALLQDGERAAVFCRAAREAGHHIALDDFGIGYNSFARITQLPVDVLKVDRQFVKDLAHDAASGGVVRAMVTVADDLGLRLVAEGVEDEAALRRLAELGVVHAQGFHLGRPSPEALLRR